MKIHPQEALLQELLVSLPGEQRRILQHVVGCEACRCKAESLLRPRRPLMARIAKVLRWPGRMVDYGPVIERSACFFRSRQSAYEREREEAAGLFGELLEHPAERRWMLVRNHWRFHTWGLYELLIERSRESSFADPPAGEDLARLALELASHLDADYYGGERIEDLRARAWAYIGNSRRVRSDLRQARECFETAEQHLRLGTQDPIERAIFLDLEASLLRAERRFDDAMKLLEEALEILLAADDRHRAGRVLVNMDNVHHHAGRPEQGIPLLYRALELIDSAQEPRLLLCAWHNLIDDLAETGRFLEAHKLLLKARPVYGRFPEASAENRRVWVEGKIALGIGQYGRAEMLLTSARQGFLAENAPYDLALVSLDLATIYAEQRRLSELKQLAAEMMAIFSSRQIHREALAALTLWQRAVEAETVGRALTSEVSAFLRRARFDHELSFQASQPYDLHPTAV